MRNTRGTLIRALPIAAIVLALATTGCARTDAGEKAKPGPTATTAKPGTGFGGSPEATATATTTPTTAAPKTVSNPEPTRTKTKKPVPAWKDVVKPCPFKGQKVEIQKVLQADVTKDGVEDTLVVRGCEASTSYWASTIEVFDGTAEPAAPRRLDTLLTDVAKMDEPVVTKVSFNKGIVGVKAYGTSLKGAKACPDLILFYRYQFNGKGFDRIWRDAGIKEECKLQ